MQSVNHFLIAYNYPRAVPNIRFGAELWAK